jgi:hypothetical protein
MKRVAVKLDALLEACDFVNFGQPMEHEAYLALETGVIYYHSEYGDDEEPLRDDVEDADRYIAMPHSNDLDLGKSLVLKFARDFLPDDLEDAHEGFRRRGAYARFKDLLERRGLLQQWYDY